MYTYNKLSHCTPLTNTITICQPHVDTAGERVSSAVGHAHILEDAHREALHPCVLLGPELHVGSGREVNPKGRAWHWGHLRAWGLDSSLDPHMLVLLWGEPRRGEAAKTLCPAFWVTLKSGPPAPAAPPLPPPCQDEPLPVWHAGTQVSPRPAGPRQCFTHRRLRSPLDSRLRASLTKAAPARGPEIKLGTTGNPHLQLALKRGVIQTSSLC